MTSNQHIGALAFVSGFTVGCTSTIIMGALLMMAANHIARSRRRKQEQELPMQCRQDHNRPPKEGFICYMCKAEREDLGGKDLRKGALGSPGISAPVLEHTTYPIASVSSRHSFTATAANKTHAETHGQRSKRRLESFTCPLLREEEEPSTPHRLPADLDCTT